MDEIVITDSGMTEVLASAPDVTIDILNQVQDVVIEGTVGPMGPKGDPGVGGTTSTLLASDGTTATATDQAGVFGAGIMINPSDGGTSYINTTADFIFNSNAGATGAGAFTPFLELGNGGALLSANGATTPGINLQASAGVSLGDGTNATTFQADLLTTPRTLHFPDSDGTLVTTSDLAPIADKNFRQDFAPATTVTVTHNLGKYPAVTVITSAGDEVECEIEHLTVNQLAITFAAANGGTVICN